MLLQINSKEAKRVRALTCSALLALSFGQNFFISQPAKALSVPMVSKHASLLSPSYEKLFQGAGPATNDSNVQSEKTLDSADTSQSTDLSPMTLTQSSAAEKNNANENSDDNNKGVLKSTVSATDYLPRNNAGVMQAQSIKDQHKKNGKAAVGSLSDQAAAVKVGPLPLLETDGESQKKADTIQDAEKIQLADLWEATLTRSPDIQFIVQKLQPTSNQAHLTNLLAKALSTAAFGGLGAMTMMSPGVGSYAAASMGGSMIQTVLGMSQNKADKKAKLTSEEQIMMYDMVRKTCDKLVASYRDYKKCSLGLNRAADDLQDLQNMVSEAKSGQDAAKQLEMEYTLRKQQRDMDTIADDLQHHRQNLVDLSGVEAVAHLDKQLVEERERLKNIVNVVPDAENNLQNSGSEETDSRKDKTKTASKWSPPS